jgi:hypothetical protein
MNITPVPVITHALIRNRMWDTQHINSIHKLAFIFIVIYARNEAGVEHPLDLVFAH